MAVPRDPNPTIRLARAEDAAVIARLWHASWGSTGLARPSDPDPAAMLDRLTREIARAWTVWVADLRGEILGFVAIEADEQWLRQLFIRPDAQGRGIGAALLDQAKQALTAGFFLRADPENHGARRFYEREGLHFDSETNDPAGKAVYRWPGTATPPSG